MMTTNLFVIANVKQLRTDSSFRILLPFFRTSLCVDFLNSAIFNSFHNRVEFGTILEGLRNFGGRDWTPPNPPSVSHWYKVGVMWFTAAVIEGLQSLQKFKTERCYNEKKKTIVRDCCTYKFMWYRAVYRSMSARVAQYKNYPFGVNTMIEFFFFFF